MRRERGEEGGGERGLPNRLTPGYVHHRHDASPLLRFKHVAWCRPDITRLCIRPSAYLPLSFFVCSRFSLFPCSFFVFLFLFPTPVFSFSFLLSFS